jgi:integration host factor subunit beta
MNKSDLAKTIAVNAKLPKKTAEDVVNTIFDSLTSELADGGRIEIRGFGSFYSKTYEAREGRNPRTGEAINVPEKTHVLFRVGKELKGRVDAVNRDEDDTQ